MKFGRRSNPQLTQTYARVKVQNDIIITLTLFLLSALFYSQFSGGCNLEDIENVEVYYAYNLAII